MIDRQSYRVTEFYRHSRLEKAPRLKNVTRRLGGENLPNNWLKNKKPRPKSAGSHKRCALFSFSSCQFHLAAMGKFLEKYLEAISIADTEHCQNAVEF